MTLHLIYISLNIFSQLCYKTYVLVDKSSLKWAPGEPNNLPPKEHCLHVNKIFKFELSIESYTKLNILQGEPIKSTEF